MQRKTNKIKENNAKDRKQRVIINRNVKNINV